jgi:streptogramin lyase
MCSDFKTTSPATTTTSGGIITTIAGNGVASVTGNGGLAVNAGLSNPTSVVADLDGNIFYIDTNPIENTCTIRKIDENGIISDTGIAFTEDIATGGFQSLITCFTIDNAGNIYFCNKNYIYKLVSQGTGYIASEVYRVPLLAGISIFEMSHIAFDNTTTDTLITSLISRPDIVRIRLREYSPDAFYEEFITNVGSPINPDFRPVTVDSLGNVYSTLMSRTGTSFFNYVYSWQVRKFNQTGGVVWTVNLGSKRTPGDTYRQMLLNAITIGPDGSVYVSNVLSGINRVLRIDKDTQNITTFAGGGPRPLFSGDGGPAILSNLDNPNGIVFDSKSNMFICDSNNRRIRKVTPFVTTTIPGKTTYNPPWFAPVEYIEICNCKINTHIPAEEIPIAIYDGL